MNPYENCPTYTTERFLLRRVERSDAEVLLTCYADPRAVANMNADCCTSDFHFTTLEQMRDCIDMWLREYDQGRYVRFAVADRRRDRVVGTVEIFGGARGVLRVDLPVEYEDAGMLAELAGLAVNGMARDFPMEALYFKAGTSPARRDAALARGFRPSEGFRPGQGYFEYRMGGETV